VIRQSSASANSSGACSSASSSVLHKETLKILHYGGFFFEFNFAEDVPMQMKWIIISILTLYFNERIRIKEGGKCHA